MNARKVLNSVLVLVLLTAMLPLSGATASQLASAPGTWVPTGSLHTARYYHTATLLPNGKVLVVGGCDEWHGCINGTFASVELYDPATGVWSVTGSLNHGRALHTATLLPDGRVLVVGGYDSDSQSILTSAELYDSATGAWSLTGNLNNVHTSHSATLLPNGQVLVVGGTNGSGISSTIAELYNPATGVWSVTGSLNHRRAIHTATLLSDGRVLVAGGCDEDTWCTDSSLTTAELYYPGTGTWIPTGNLNAGRYGHTATLLPDGRVLVAGGHNLWSWLASAELYDPATETWSATGGLAITRVYHTATLLPNGQVLVAGGQGSGASITGVELYNSATETWSATGSLAIGRTAHTATLLPNSQVLVAGGGGHDVPATSSAELYGTSLLALSILQFDGYITSTVPLDGFYAETVQSLAAASLGHPEKTAILLVDRSGTTPDAIFKIYDGVMTNITADWPGMTAEVDATDGQFLGRFVAWARGRYPATRTTLSVVGHGLYAPPEMGTSSTLLRSAAQSDNLFPLPKHIGGSPNWSDINPRPGVFSTYDASEMLRIGSNDGASPLDVVDFSQCFGASVEEFAPLRNYARMLTGSPNYAFYDPAMSGAGLAALDPGQTPASMATALITAYHAALPATQHPRVLVAVDTTYLDYLKDRLDWLSQKLLDGLSNPDTRTDYRAMIREAYNASLHYDTTGCSPQDWNLCSPDAMVDVGTFAEQIQAQFGALSEVGLAAGEVAGAVQAVVSVKLAQNDKPWFGALPWDFTPGVGLGLYADFLGRSDGQGGVILNGISHWYTSTVTLNDNPHPYEFIAANVYGATWADVLHSFWAGTTLTTELCLSASPGLLEAGEVAAIKVLFPIKGLTKINTIVTPTVVFSTANVIHNSVVAITITQNSAVVYTDTLHLGYHVTGTYAVEANHAWTPAVTGKFTLIFEVDSGDRISETNEADNTFTMTDWVQAAPLCAPPIITAAIVGGQQWITASQVALNIAQTGGLACPVTQLIASFNGFQAGQNSATQVPVKLEDRIIKPISLPKSGYSLSLPTNAAAGVIVVYLWPFSNLGGYGSPVLVTFNYTPPAIAIGNGTEHFYRFTVAAGEQVQMTCQTGQGSARLYVWEPGNPASALSILCPGSLPLDPTQAGEYIVSVAGLANTTYTLTAMRGVVPLRASASTLVEHITRSRPTFVEPIPELPTPPNLKVYLSLLRR